MEREIPANPDALLTEEEAASLLGLSMRTLQTWRTRGLEPAFVRLRRTIRYRRGALDEWIKKNTHLV